MTRRTAFRFEQSLTAFFVLCWLVFAINALAGYPAGGILKLGLYPLYSLAVASGWILGNIYVQRTAGQSRTSRRRLFWSLLLSASGLFFLLWSLQSTAARQAVPLAAVFAYAIFALFFLVPVSFRRR